MNGIINKFCLHKVTSSLEIYLRKRGLMYSACGPFTKHKERIKDVKETGGSTCICQTQPEKACFQHDLAYSRKKI